MGLLLIDNQFLPQARAVLESAQKTIDIATFKGEITTKPRGHDLKHFFALLLKKAREGVKVRLLINWNTERKSVPKTNLYVIQELKKNNIQVRHLRNNRCCHAKVILIDKDKAIVGSHNLSVKSCHNNFEISYVIPDPAAITKLSSVFDNSWMDAEKG